MSTPSDLQALFANLKPLSNSGAPANASNTAAAQSSNTNTSFDPATLFNRPSPGNNISSPPIQSSSRMTSPYPQSTGSGQDRAQSLLSLLKSGTAKEGSQNLSASDGFPAHGNLGSQARGISASDLVASFMHNASAQPFRASQAHSTGEPHSTTDTPQNALLKLLNRSQSTNSLQAPQPTKPPSNQMSESVLPSIEQSAQDISSGSVRKPSPIRVFGSTESKENTPFEPSASSPVPAPKENKPLFTYTNPFETLTAMSRNQTPQPQPQRVATKSPGLQNGSSYAAADQTPSKEASPASASRRILMPHLKKSGSLADSLTKETVSDNLEVVASEETVAADEALARSVPDRPIKKENLDDEVSLGTLADKLPLNAPEAAAQRKKERDRPDNKGALEQESATPFTGEARPTVNSAAENAMGRGKEPEKAQQDGVPHVPVYNFPIKPFVSITLNLPQKASVGLRDDGVMEISRFKKEFDQLDRVLAAATSKYIVYALVKSGGMRVIRQDDGSDRQIFKTGHDRIFNVAMCSTASNSTPTEEQAILGTGVGGSVYYATIFRDGNDLFEQDALESESLIFPPYPLGDENTSGGQLKTRAKKSSRHPEFFAIGRGKHIHVVWPTLAMNAKYGVEGENRTVDIEKFYKERTLKITTGKAGKDFNFSEDDTTIISLDKTGRLRFWDIRPLVDESNATAAKIRAVDIRTPLLTLSTATTSEKVWPTSTLFIDKLRPYSKATALRYVLVGLRQNHTLQLWDIGLGKAVQEINFPHETENDGICSISYHPSSGIVIVGHPTRNSIYFIHLSAPRYALPPMSQATYIERISAKDPDLPKPESTACMSGIREMSFSSKGQLRSVELLPVHKSTPQAGDDPPMLFELYVVHSRGVTCLSIRRQDLGWNEESKTLHPINALEEGYIAMKGLDVGALDNEDQDAIAEPETQPPAKSSKKKNQTAAEDTPTPPTQLSARETSPVKGAVNPSTSSGDNANPIEQVTEPPSSKKKKKRSQQQAVAATAAANAQADSEARQPRSISPQKASISTAKTDEKLSELSASAVVVPRTVTGEDSSAQANVQADGAINVGISGNWLDREMKKLESGITTVLKKDFDSLHRQIDMERKVQDAAAATRQEAMLRLVSETLSDNVEKSLARIIISNFQQAVIPTLTNATVSTIDSVLVRHLHGIVSAEIGKNLPMAISAAFSNPQTLRVLTDSVSQRIAHAVENAFTELLHTTITPSFKNLAINTVESMSLEIERRVTQQLQTYETERRADRKKTDQMMETVNDMARTLADMARSQVEFQQQILHDRKAMGISAPNGEAAARQPFALSPADAEADKIRTSLREGDYHNATLTWLKSEQQDRLFDEIFAPVGPNYLGSEVAPLVSFSVAIALSNSLTTNTRAKIDWIDVALQCIDIRDTEIAAIADQVPQILADFVSRLESCYMAIHQQNTSDPLLKTIPSITKRAKELRLVMARGGTPVSYSYGA